MTLHHLNFYHLNFHYLNFHYLNFYYLNFLNLNFRQDLSFHQNLSFRQNLNFRHYHYYIYYHFHIQYHVQPVVQYKVNLMFIDYLHKIFEVKLTSSRTFRLSIKNLYSYNKEPLIVIFFSCERPVSSKYIWSRCEQRWFRRELHLLNHFEQYSHRNS